MKKVIYLLVIVPVLMLVSCDQNAAAETDSKTTQLVSNSVKDVSPEEFAKLKLEAAIKCKSEIELEAVIVNFEQFINVLTASGDQGKMIAKNILQQDNVTTQFYDEFVTESFAALENSNINSVDGFEFNIENTKTENDLTMHRIKASSTSGTSIKIEVMEGGGFYYLGQIRKKN